MVPKLPLGNAAARDSLEEVVRNSDFLSLHVPAEAGTNNLIGARELAWLKKGSFLINASRGTVVDISAAAAALRSGHLGGAAFDVFPDEPAAAGDPFQSELQGCKNTILTPHVGGSTEEAQVAIGKEVAQKMDRGREAKQRDGRTGHSERCSLQLSCAHAHPSSVQLCPFVPVRCRTSTPAFPWAA